MSRRDGERLQDILDAIDAIRSHVARGGLSDGLIFDAVRVRLIEIGEAIKAISPELLDNEPGHPWTDIDRIAIDSPIGTSTRTTATSPGLSNTTSTLSQQRCCDSRADFLQASSACHERWLAARRCSHPPRCAHREPVTT